MTINLYGCDRVSPPTDEERDEALRLPSTGGLVSIGDILREQVIPNAALAKFMRERRERRDGPAD